MIVRCIPLVKCLCGLRIKIKLFSSWFYCDAAFPAFFSGFEFAVFWSELPSDAWLSFAFPEFRKNWPTSHWIHHQIAGKWMQHHLMEDYHCGITNMWVIETCLSHWPCGCLRTKWGRLFRYEKWVQVVLRWSWQAPLGPYARMGKKIFVLHCFALSSRPRD